MFASYRLMEEEKLRALRSGQEIEELLEEDEWGDDIGELWDALHVLLTGVSAGQPIPGDLRSQAIVGETALEAEVHLGSNTAEQAEKISHALEETDPDALLSEAELLSFARKGIYPAQLWSRKELHAGLKQDLKGAFETLNALYRRAAAEHCGVLIMIG